MSNIVPSDCLWRIVVTQIAPDQFFTFCEEIQSALMEISCQINHQIEHNTIEIHKLEDLIACS